MLKDHIQNALDTHKKRGHIKGIEVKHVSEKGRVLPDIIQNLTLLHLFNQQLQ